MFLSHRLPNSSVRCMRGRPTRRGKAQRRPGPPSKTNGDTTVAPTYIGIMHADIERILISQQQIAVRVKELAQLVTTDLSTSSQGEITIVPILTGAMIF